MISVNFYSKPKFAYPRRKFLKLIKSICKRFGVSSAAVNIVIANNRQIRSFNKEFHHRDTVTDCLSFDLSESHFTAEHAETAEIRSKINNLLRKKTKNISASSAKPGAVPRVSFCFAKRRRAVKKSFDIIVNAQKAKAEAAKRGHSSQAELALYITHGLLHNLGFDDHYPKKAKLMHQMEDEILQHQGFGRVYKDTDLSCLPSNVVIGGANSKD